MLLLFFLWFIVSVIVFLRPTTAVVSKLPKMANESLFSLVEYNGWFEICKDIDCENTSRLTARAKKQFNTYLENVAKIKGMDVDEVEIDDSCVEGFVFCSSFVNKQTITSIRTTLYYPLIRALKEDHWETVDIRSFCGAFLAATKRLKVSEKYIPSTKTLHPMLDADIVTIVKAIPDCLQQLKAVVHAVFTFSSCTGARSVSLANIRPGDILQCLPVTSLFSSPSQRLSLALLLTLSHPPFKIHPTLPFLPCFLPSRTPLLKPTLLRPFFPLAHPFSLTLFSFTHLLP